MRKSIEYNNGGSAGFIYADCITNIFIDDSENCIYITTTRGGSIYYGAYETFEQAYKEMKRLNDFICESIVINIKSAT